MATCMSPYFTPSDTRTTGILTVFGGRSVFRGGSTAIFIFAYGIYFQYRIKEGNFGALFIFMCYNACFCYALFLILGAVSFYASLYVYGTEKLNLHKRD